MSIVLKNVAAPQPATERNFGSHLDYDEATNSIAYACGKSAFVRSLEDDSVVQFTGHASANVTVVRFSPIKNSQFVCSGDSSGKVIVWGWNRENGIVETTIKSEFQVLAGAISDVSWDFEGRRLCVVGEGRDQFGVFISWDSGNSLGEVSGHSQRINACHFKQSRPMRCVTVGDDGAVVMYQGPPFKFSASDRSHHDQGKFIRDVRFSPGSGDYVISVGSDRKIVAFDGKTGEFIKYIEDSNEKVEGGIFGISWVDEKTFVTASADATVRLWNYEESKCLQKWKLPNSAVGDQQVGIVASKNGEVISLSLDGTLNFFKAGEDNLLKTLVGHNKGITSLSVNPTVTGSYDGRIVAWEGEKAKEKCDKHTNKIVAIDNSEPGKIASISWDDTLTVGDEVKHTFEQLPKAASSDNKGVTAVLSNADELSLINSQTGEIIQSVKLQESASAVGLTNDLVAVGLETSKNVQVFKASDLSVTYKLNTPLRANATAISISPSGKYLAAGDSAGKVLLYDLESKDLKTSRWSFHTSTINSIAWRPQEDEEYVVTSSLDTNIAIYSVSRPMRVIKFLNAHKDGVTNVQWDTADTLVSVGSDACVRKWAVTFE